MRDRQTAFFMVGPTVVAVALVFVYPLLISLWTSFRFQVLSQPGLDHFTGLGNYQWLLTDPTFWDALRRTLVYFVFTVSVSMALGMFVALLLEGQLGRFGWMRPLYLVPMVVTPVVAGIEWRFLLNNEFGALSWLLRLLHLPAGDWLTQPSGAMFWVIMVDIWYNTPYVILLFGAGLASIPSEIRDAAKVDGASAWQTTMMVIIPMLRQVVGVVLLIRTIGGLRAFDTILVITDGGPGRATELINLLIYRYALQYFDMGKAAAMGWVMLLVAMALTVIYMNWLHVGEANV